MTHSYVWHHPTLFFTLALFVLSFSLGLSFLLSLTIFTRWRKVIRCLKLQVIFRKRATMYRALLQKMTCRDKASYDFTPPCNDSQRQQERETEREREHTECECEQESWVMSHVWMRHVTHMQASGTLCAVICLLNTHCDFAFSYVSKKLGASHSHTCDTSPITLW